MMPIARVIAGVAMAFALLVATLSSAQQVSPGDEPDVDAAGVATADDAAAPTEIPKELLEHSVIDEVVVSVDPQGRTAYEIEAERIEQIRESIYAEMELRAREQEELAWRQADPDLENPESRIKWGYSPQAEQRFRRENDFIHDLPTDQTKPASLIRVQF